MHAASSASRMRTIPSSQRAAILRKAEVKRAEVFGQPLGWPPLACTHAAITSSTVIGGGHPRARRRVLGGGEEQTMPGMLTRGTHGGVQMRPITQLVS